MKRILFILAAAATLTACHQGTPRPSLKSDIDTLSYEIGLSQTPGIESYFAQSGIDSAYIDDFLRGIREGAMAGDNKKRLAYYAGIQTGIEMKTQLFPDIQRKIFGDDSPKTLSVRNYLAGFTAGVKHRSALKVDGQVLGPEEAGVDAQARFQAMRETLMAEQFAPQREAADEFMAKKAADTDYRKLPGGVLYKVLKEGTGALPADTSVVEVEYEGRLTDGNIFDSTAQHNNGKPAAMPVKGFISGFQTALKQMPVGSEWEIVIPYDQAYGTQGYGPIPPYAPIIFKVQLVGIRQQ